MKNWRRTIFLFLIFVFSCADLERDNILDPKNPNSKVERINLAEIFVNDSTGYPYCEHALQALDEIRDMEQYNDNLLVLEYHVESEKWNDPFEIEGALQRYHRYVADPTSRGIPDVFFNGAENRVQGATSENVKNRYLETLGNFTETDAFFRLEGVKTIENDELQLDLQVARLGDRDAKDVLLQAIIIENLGVPLHRSVVRKILSPITISELTGGTVRSFTFSSPLPEETDPSRIFVVVFIQKNDVGWEVFQAKKF